MHVIDHNDPFISPIHRSPLWHAVEALGAAAAAIKRFFGAELRNTSAWALIVLHHRRPPAAGRAH